MLCRLLRSVVAICACTAVLAAGSLASRVALGASFDAEVLDQLPAKMQRFVDDKVVSGLVAVIGSQDGVAKTVTLGTRTTPDDQPMPADAVFRIASMTKPIVAIAVLQLQEQGRLRVEDPVEKYLPEFRDQLLIASQDGELWTLKRPSRPIQLRDLLTHTSGLPGGYPSGLADLYNSRDLTLAESVYVSSQRPLRFEPGTKWEYCNAGIDTLGRVVEVVSGMPFETYMQQHIFAPLGMVDTTFALNESQRDRLVGLYEQKEGELVEVQHPLIGNLEHPRHPIPAGGLLSTAGDLSRLYQCLLNGGELDGHRLIATETLQEMTKVHTGDLLAGFSKGMGFGYGFAVVSEPQGVTEQMSPGSFGHGGAFGTQGWMDPTRDVFVVLLIQRSGLQGGDDSDLRKQLQDVAYEALKK